MKISENPVVPGKITNVKEFEGGKKGVVICLTNEAGEQLVVKLQKDPAAAQSAAQRVMQSAGAPAPGLRTATAADLQALEAAMAEATDAASAKAAASYRAGKGKYPVAILMEFVRGETLNSMKERALGEFLAIFASASFLKQLGTILAVDEFTGNADRMAANKTPWEPDGAGWTNDGNLLMSGGDARPIDNDFTPGSLHMAHLDIKQPQFGRHVIVLQGAGMMCANLPGAKTEAGMLFDYFIKVAEERYPNAGTDLEAARGKRPMFVDGVAVAAVDTMAKLLKAGQHWKQHFKTDGIVDEKLRTAFRQRKRMLRIMADPAVSPGDAHKTASNEDKWHKHRLTTELGYAENEADKILEGGIAAYKQAKAVPRNV